MQRYTKKTHHQEHKTIKALLCAPLCGAHEICPKVLRVEKTSITKHKKLIAQEMLYNKHYKYHTRIPYKTIIRIEGGKNMKIRMFVSVLNVCKCFDNLVVFCASVC